VPCEPPRLTTFRRHYEDIQISVVHCRERDPLAIRREDRQILVSSGGQLPGIAAIARYAPEVAAIGKYNVGLAQRRRVRQQRRLLRRARYACPAEQDTDQNCHSKTHASSMKENKFVI
jgi:hypothetical protein